jgi:hypothetical protein
MISRQQGESFVPTKTLYAAIYEETQQLILVVEAADEEEAGHRIDAVLPFFGVNEVAGIGFVEVKSCPLGVASFLDAFFKGTGLGSVRDSVGPSTYTRH